MNQFHPHYSSDYVNPSVSNESFKPQSTSVGGNPIPSAYSSYLPPANTDTNLTSKPNYTRPKARRSKSLDYSSEYNYYEGSDMNQNKKKRKKSFSKAETAYWTAGNARKMSTTGSDYGSNSPLIKRPRGRPPLNAAGVPIPFPSTSTASSITTTVGRKSSQPPSSSQANVAPNSSLPNSAPLSSTNGTNTNPKSSAASNTNGGNDGEPIKIPRPTYKFVVSKVLSKLMVSDPISASDLTKILPDCPKDMIHSVLEISQVLGMVIQSKAKEGLRHDYPAGTIVYSLINYVKGPSAISLDKIEADIAERVEKEKKAALRMAELHVRSALIKFISDLILW